MSLQIANTVELPFRYERAKLLTLAGPKDRNMNSLVRANLHKPPNRIIIDSAGIHDAHRKWTQPYDLWTVFILMHDGFLSVGNVVHPFHANCVAVVAPGSKCEFGRAGEGCDAHMATFNLEGETHFDVAAIPTMTDIGDEARRYIARHERSRASMTWTVGDARAWVWDLLWSLAQPPDRLRVSPVLVKVEEFIAKNLSSRLTVSEVTRTSEISQSQLLRLFRQEHGVTIQQYVRDERVAKARHLITSTDDPIKSIAHEVGIPDLQHFNKLVKASTGFSPRELRDRFKGKTDPPW